MNKKDLWPQTGKLKKAMIILGVVIVSALLIVLAEEKTGNKISKKASMAIAFLCVGIWIYQPVKKERT